MSILAELQQEEKTLKNRLEERRAQFQGATGMANQVAATGFEKAGQGVNPLTILNQLQQFRESGMGTISPLERQLADLRNQQMNERQMQLQEKKFAFDQQQANQPQGLSTKDLLDLQLKANEKGMELVQDESGAYVLKPSEGIDATSRKLAGMSVGAKTEVSNLSSAIKDMSGLVTPLEGRVGITSKLTGPLAKLFGGIAPREDYGAYRENLDVFRENIRKDLYGTAFTDAEKKSAVLPGSGKQEGVNRRRLESMMERKVKQLKTRLEVEGWSKREIEDYVSSLTGQSQAAQLSSQAEEAIKEVLGQ